MTAPLLSLRDVTMRFTQGAHEVLAVDDISLDVARGECLAIVGESGSGKTTVANLILGVFSPTAGEIAFDGVALPPRRTLPMRRAIQLVQQNPYSSLNPRRSVGASLRLPLDVHRIGERSERTARVEALLGEVGLPANFHGRRPSALSGGQCQRVAIARALACDSEIVVFDEPTSALDVLVQARVLRLLADLKTKRGLTYIFITHDLSVVRNVADRVAVFEKGRVVETGAIADVFTRPKHPYTRRLIGAVPVVTKEELDLRESLSAGEVGNG
jgi:ABC-type glutathione transport system ATPase component